MKFGNEVFFLKGLDFIPLTRIGGGDFGSHLGNFFCLQDNVYVTDRAKKVFRTSIESGSGSLTQVDFPVFNEMIYYQSGTHVAQIDLNSRELYQLNSDYSLTKTHDKMSFNPKFDALGVIFGSDYWLEAATCTVVETEAV